MRATIEILAVLVATVVMLLRVAHIPAWELVYAEDNGVFLVGALAHPWDLLAPFARYLELVPRILGQIVSLLPIWDAARVYAVSGALIAAVCALFTYYASEGYIRSPWLRAMLGGALILLPLTHIGSKSSVNRSPWSSSTSTPSSCAPSAGTCRGGRHGLLGLNGATAVVGVFLLAVLALVLITGDRQVRVFAMLATVIGFVQLMIVASLRGPPGAGWVAYGVANPTFQPCSRYTPSR